jgi:hypothetical protein
MKNMWLPAREPPRCATEQRPATRRAAELSDASKLGLDVLPVRLELPCEGGFFYPIQVVDAPLQLVERELGGLSVSLGFLRAVANAGRLPAIASPNPARPAVSMHPRR